MKNPKVSVLLPTYNHEQYLTETIESVLNQTFTDFELLITDDCSTDKSAEVICGYKDERITATLFEKNQGTVRALNYLLRMAKGEYIAVLGSDDVWEPTKLECQVAFLENNPNYAACFTKATIINQDSQMIDEDSALARAFDMDNLDHAHMLKEFFLTGNHFCHSSVLIRTSVHREIGEYNLAYRQLHDLDLWVRLLIHHDVYIMDEKYVRYRFVENSGNVSQNTTKNNSRMYNEAIQIIEYLIENIRDEDFVSAFSDLFVNNCVENKSQINCEKYFILKNSNWWNCCNTSVALQFLFHHLDVAMLDSMEQDYDVSLRQLYEDMSMEQEHNFSRMEWLQKEKDALQTQVDALYASTSWRMTKPLRALTSMLRKEGKR